MEVFIDLAPFAMPAAIIGGVIFFLGFLLKANAKKEALSSVFATLMLTVGIALILFAASTWIAQAIEDWGIFSSRMTANML